MCLAVPAKVIRKKGDKATVDVLGNTLEADISLLPEVEIGDYLLVHTGIAIQKFDPEEAQETLRIIGEVLKEDQ